MTFTLPSSSVSHSTPSSVCVHSHVSFDFSANTRHFSTSFKPRPAATMSATYLSTESSMPFAFWAEDMHTAKSPSAMAELPPRVPIFSTSRVSAPAFLASYAAASPA